jgi:hypothetical protein
MIIKDMQVPLIPRVRRGRVRSSYEVIRILEQKIYGKYAEITAGYKITWFRQNHEQSL